MKLRFQLLLGALFLSGCTTFNNAANISGLPVPPEQTLNVHSRFIASTYVEEAYAKYFADGNFYQRVAKIEAVAKQLLSVMPDKGHPKRKLVEQFVSDARKEIIYLGSIQSSVSDKSNSFLPSAQLDQYNAKIQSLGRLTQSYKIMNRAGIYLTASGVFEEDSSNQDFYLSILDRSTYEIENGLRELVLVYKPEDKDAQENNAKMNYSRSLAQDTRNSIRRVLEVKSAEYKKVDAVLASVARLSSSNLAKKLVRTVEFTNARNILKAANNINSGDIEGFQDDMDTTISTKFNLELINELILSTR
ncbi:hypothetical protein K2P97_08355 [bacterium]|nr:hypothetical protein [bacterium]